MPKISFKVARVGVSLSARYATELLQLQVDYSIHNVPFCFISCPFEWDMPAVCIELVG